MEPDNELKPQVDDAFLMRLADQLENEWRRLGTHLAIKKAEVDRCLADHPGNEAEAVYAMLVLWFTRTRDKGPGVQTRTLAEALKKCGRRDLAEAVEERHPE
ncbi:peptidase C14A [Branchiostoma belcheri]|nr:peptidase C14A [Branchiostoma belcheri]